MLWKIFVDIGAGCHLLLPHLGTKSLSVLKPYTNAIQKP
jgi:hypothetical protein